MTPMSECDILVLEDEAFIAMDIEMTLADAGYKSIAICHTVVEAMEQIDKGNPKIALLDFNLGKDATSVPVAERLSQSDVPVVFLSGYTEFTVEIPDGLSNAQRLAKPFRSAELVEQVERVLGGS